MATLLEIMQLVASEVGYASGTATTTSTTTTLIDTSGDSPFDTDDSSSLYDNSWVMLETGTGAGVSNVRRITTYTPASSEITVSRAFGTTPTTTHSYGVYFGYPPVRHGATKGLREYINETLRELRYKGLTLITLVTDGDMETSGTTNWTASSATVTKSTSYATQGLYSLRVANSGANGYARTASIPVQSGSTVFVAADVKAVTGTAELILYDATNSAAIDSSTATDLTHTYLSFSAQIPATCRSVQIRLAGQGASDDIYWDNITLRQMSQRSIPLPSWVVNDNMVEDFEYWAYGNVPQTGAEGSLATSRYKHDVAFWSIDYDGSLLSVFIEPPNYNGHIFMRALKPYSELTDITETTDANKDLVKALVLTRIYNDRGDQQLAQRWASEGRILYQKYAPRIERKMARFKRFW